MSKDPHRLPDLPDLRTQRCDECADSPQRARFADPPWSANLDDAIAVPRRYYCSACWANRTRKLFYDRLKEEYGDADTDSAMEPLIREVNSRAFPLFENRGLVLMAIGFAIVGLLSLANSLGLFGVCEHC